MKRTKQKKIIIARPFEAFNLKTIYMTQINILNNSRKSLETDQLATKGK